MTMHKFDREMNKQQEEFLRILKYEILKRPYFEGSKESKNKSEERFTQGKNKTFFRCKLLCEGLTADILFEVEALLQSHEYNLKHIYVICKELQISGKEISRERMHDFKIFYGRVEVCKVRV